jgi:hypothetical protein
MSSFVMSGKALDLETLASFEVSSEDASFPFENVLKNNGEVWKAGDEGPEVIKIRFNCPQDIPRIFLQFDEFDVSRTQEFLLHWQKEGEGFWTELRCQQYNFSPGTFRENETIDVKLEAAVGLQLRIIPSVSAGAVASLTRLSIH